jgi:hypothetical protein
MVGMGRACAMTIVAHQAGGEAAVMQMTISLRAGGCGGGCASLHRSIAHPSPCAAESVAIIVQSPLPKTQFGLAVEGDYCPASTCWLPLFTMPAMWRFWCVWCGSEVMCTSAWFAHRLSLTSLLGPTAVPPISLPGRLPGGRHPLPVAGRPGC